MRTNFQSRQEHCLRLVATRVIMVVTFTVMVVREEIKDKQTVGKRQQYSDCHAKLVSASNEFGAL